MSKTLKDKLIKTLIDSKHLKQEDLEDAVVMQKKRGVSLERALIDKGLISEKEVLMLLVRELNIPFINLAKYKIDPGLQEFVPERVARQYQIIPLSVLEHTMTIAIADPLNVFAIDDIKSITGREVEVMMSTNTDILKAIDNYYG
ncbi:MAG: type II secretion system protein GspE, partial [Candidatus Omnitrophica bacterium]|nr:type II secretion system protein GspE [Candidatus Omnitrophota bacterium]